MEYSNNKKFNRLYMRMGLINNHKNKLIKNCVRIKSLKKNSLYIENKKLKDKQKLEIYKKKLSELNKLFSNFLNFVDKHSKKIEELIILNDKELINILKIGNQNYLKLKKEQLDTLNFKTAEIIK